MKKLLINPLGLAIALLTAYFLVGFVVMVLGVGPLFATLIIFLVPGLLVGLVYTVSVKRFIDQQLLLKSLLIYSLALLMLLLLLLFTLVPDFPGSPFFSEVASIALVFFVYALVTYFMISVGSKLGTKIVMSS